MVAGFANLDLDSMNIGISAHWLEARWWLAVEGKSGVVIGGPHRLKEAHGLMTRVIMGRDGRVEMCESPRMPILELLLQLNQGENLE